MLRISTENPADVIAREALLDEAFGLERFAKTCERLREGRLPAQGLALVARDDADLVGTLRFWHVEAGAGCPALILGPLAVAASHRSAGIGGKLMRRGLTLAGAHGHRAVLLVGDEAYYRKFGFSRALASRLDLPGWYAPERFLGMELQNGALAGASGMVRPTGQFSSETPTMSKEGEAGFAEEYRG